MSPYRTPAPDAPREPCDDGLDERPLLWFLLLLGGLRAGYLLLRERPWDTGSAVLALVACLVARELLASLRRERS